MCASQNSFDQGPFGVTAAKSFNNKLCLSQGFLFTLGVHAVVAFAAVIVWNLHLTVVWRNRVLDKRPRIVAGIVWIYSIMMSLIPVFTNNIENIPGAFCMVSYNASLPMFFGPQSVFVFPSLFLHLITASYIFQVYRKNRKYTQYESDGAISSVSGGGSSGVTRRHFNWVREQWNVQWRGAVLVFLLDSVWLSLAIVYYLGFKFTIKLEDAWVTQWLTCLFINAPNGQDQCAYLAHKGGASGNGGGSRNGRSGARSGNGIDGKRSMQGSFNAGGDEDEYGGGYAYDNSNSVTGLKNAVTPSSLSGNGRFLNASAVGGGGGRTNHGNQYSAEQYQMHEFQASRVVNSSSVNGNYPPPANTYSSSMPDIGWSMNDHVTANVNEYASAGHIGNHRRPSASIPHESWVVHQTQRNGVNLGEQFVPLPAPAATHGGRRPSGQVYHGLGGDGWRSQW
ncbi:hypothetical protein HDU76_003989 [Blyttiomyces sp. JEL0837]|nr:hypothetical protein HDU76_003989 [Blyttiomyces sp. JEL0837]